MLLCLDIGNSHIFGGVFSGSKLQLSFRYPSNQVNTSDQIGVFLKNVLSENGLDSATVTRIAICSVVPHLNYSLRAACIKYFALTPFLLQAGVRTGLRIMTKNPREIGADRIANSLAAAALFPDNDLIIVDFGTATTFCVISSQRDYLGGPILPGLRISMESLTANAALLSPVNIVAATRCLGRTTTENIQSGLYYGQLGAVKEILRRLSAELFRDTSPIVIGTGGFAQLFADEHMFTEIIPDLVLHGLRIALEKNTQHAEQNKVSTT